MQAHGMPNEKVHQLRALGENLIQVEINSFSQIQVEINSCIFINALQIAICNVLS